MCKHVFLAFHCFICVIYSLLDSEQPLLDLHELANVATEPDSQRSPVKVAAILVSLRKYFLSILFIGDSEFIDDRGEPGRGEPLI